MREGVCFVQVAGQNFSVSRKLCLRQQRIHRLPTARSIENNVLDHQKGERVNMDLRLCRVKPFP